MFYVYVLQSKKKMASYILDIPLTCVAASPDMRKGNRVPQNIEFRSIWYITKHMSRRLMRKSESLNLRNLRVHVLRSGGDYQKVCEAILV